MPPVGRPTKYKKEYAEQAYKLCLLGFIDAELAKFFEVDVVTLNKWKRDFPEFLMSIKGGKEIANSNVAESLYKRAMGYEHDEEKVFCNMGEITTHQTVKHYPPDTQAASLFLRNRQPDKWRDKQEIDHQSSDGSMSPNQEMSDDELKDKLKGIGVEC